MLPLTLSEKVEEVLLLLCHLRLIVWQALHFGFKRVQYLNSIYKLYSIRQLHTHYLKGGLFETLILTELAKYRYNKGLEPHIYFWRDNKGSEVDCIVEHRNSLIPVEIKAGKTISNDFFKMLHYWSKLASDKAGIPYLIYGGTESQNRSMVRVKGWHEAVHIYN